MKPNDYTNPGSVLHTWNLKSRDNSHKRTLKIPKVALHGASCRREGGRCCIQASTLACPWGSNRLHPQHSLSLPVPLSASLFSSAAPVPRGRAPPSPPSLYIPLSPNKNPSTRTLLHSIFLVSATFFKNYNRWEGGRAGRQAFGPWQAAVCHSNVN